MQITKSALSASLRQAGLVRPDRVNIIPQMGSVMINAMEKGHGGVVTQSVVEVEDVGSIKAFQVPFQHFRAIVDSMPDGMLTLKTVDADTVTVQSGRTRLKTRSICDPAVDVLSIDNAVSSCTLNGVALRGAIGQTLHAIAQKNPLPSLNTMRLEVSAGKAETIATDGRRMMVSRFDAEHNGGDIAVSIVDVALPMLAAMCEDGDVSINIVGKSVVIARGDWLCRMPVVENYPNWRRILTKGSNDDPQFTVEAPSLLAAMRRMIIVAEGETGQGRYGQLVRITTEGEALKLALVGNDSEDAVSIEYSGKTQIDIGTDARQIAELLAAIGDSKVNFTYIASGSNSGRIVVLPDNQRDMLTSRYVSTIAECRI